MNKKQYEQPQATIVKIGLNDNIMDSVSILTASTGSQFSRRTDLWDDEDEEEDW